MTWIYFALLAPLFWAFSNYVDKYSLDKYVTNIHDFLFFSTITSWIFAPILIFLFGFPALTIYSIFPVITGIFLIYSYGFYGKALEEGETSRIIIIGNLMPVLTIILGFLLLGQNITPYEGFVFLLILFGAALLTFERFESKYRLFAGAKWIFIAIFLWSSIFLLSDWALTKMDFWDFFILDIFGTALAGPIMLAIPHIRHQIVRGIKESKPQKYSWFIFNNFLDFFGQMSVRKALFLAPSAGMVTIALQIQSLYVIILGAIMTLFFPHIITEDISRKNLLNKIIGSLIIFTGIYLLVINN